jgi:hypothetical protein
LLALKWSAELSAKKFDKKASVFVAVPPFAQSLLIEFKKVVLIKPLNDLFITLPASSAISLYVLLKPCGIPPVKKLNIFPTTAQSFTK